MRTVISALAVPRREERPPFTPSLFRGPLALPSKVKSSPGAKPSRPRSRSLAQVLRKPSRPFRVNFASFTLKSRDEFWISVQFIMRPDAITEKLWSSSLATMSLKERSFT